MKLHHSLFIITIFIFIVITSTIEINIMSHEVYHYIMHKNESGNIGICMTISDDKTDNEHTFGYTFFQKREQIKDSTYSKISDYNEETAATIFGNIITFIWLILLYKFNKAMKIMRFKKQ